MFLEVHMTIKYHASLWIFWIGARYRIVDLVILDTRALNVQADFTSAAEPLKQNGHHVFA
jgi:hypothetical protein